MAAAFKLRVARPSDDIEALLPFYRDGLGLSELVRFAGHDGVDGIVLGAPHALYHLEFTRTHGETVGRTPTLEHLLAFYFADTSAWKVAVASMRVAGFAPVASANPYWDRTGLTFQDPDGYRTVLNNGDWTR